MWLLLLIVVAGLIYLVVKSVNKFSRMASTSPFDTLKSRYSKGEINRNEYEQMKKDLNS